jgi:hypothetical protein
LHEESNGRCWIGMPSKRFKKANGTASYTNLVDFATREARSKFQGCALAAIDELLGAQ